MTQLDTAIADLFEVTQSCSAEEIGATFMEYILESQHQGWDGHNLRDKAAYARLIEDFALALKSFQRGNPVLFTGSRYLTRDR
jgi:hypothetical protein